MSLGPVFGDGYNDDHDDDDDDDDKPL